jgi:hypothetical protein
MTKVIYKYPFVIADEQKIQLPRDHKILMVEMQGDTPCIWAEIDPKSPIVVYWFYIHGTGHKFDDWGLTHIASFQDGPMVWHLYQLKE